MGPLENEPLRPHRTLFWPTPAPRLQMGDLKASAAAGVTTAVCSPWSACPWWHPRAKAVATDNENKNQVLFVPA